MINRCLAKEPDHVEFTIDTLQALMSSFDMIPFYFDYDRAPYYDLFWSGGQTRLSFISIWGFRQLWKLICFQFVRRKTWHIIPKLCAKMWHTCHYISGFFRMCESTRSLTCVKILWEENKPIFTPQAAKPMSAYLQWLLSQMGLVVEQVVRSSLKHISFLLNKHFTSIGPPVSHLALRAQFSFP